MCLPTSAQYHVANSKVRLDFQVSKRGQTTKNQLNNGVMGHGLKFGYISGIPCRFYLHRNTCMQVFTCTGTPSPNLPYPSTYGVKCFIPRYAEAALFYIAFDLPSRKLPCDGRSLLHVVCNPNPPFAIRPFPNPPHFPQR